MTLTNNKKMEYTKEFLLTPMTDTIESSTAGSIEYSSYLAKFSSGKTADAYEITYHYLKRNLCVSFVVLQFAEDGITVTSVESSTDEMNDKIPFIDNAKMLYSVEEVNEMLNKLQEIASSIVDCITRK